MDRSTVSNRNARAAVAGDPRLQLQPASARARLWLLILMVLLPVAITALALALSFDSVAPQRLIGGSVPLTISAVTGGVAVLAVAIWWITDRLLRRHHLTLDGHDLEIVTTFYRQRLGLHELRLDQARVADLAEHTQLKPLLKTNGVEVPGFHSGWYRMRDRSKAFVARADGHRVLWIPTTRDFSLLLQPRQPQALLDALKRSAADAMASRARGR